MDAQGSGLSEYLDIVWRRRWGIVITVIVVLTVALALSLRQTPTYVSTSEVLVLPLRDPSNQSVAAPLLMENELRIAQSVAVAEIAQDLLSIEGEGPTTASISIENPAQTQTLVFEAESEAPRDARATADAYAEAYLRFRTESQLESVDTATAALETVIAALNSDIADARGALQEAESATEAEALRFEITALTTEVTAHQTRLNELELLRSARVGEFLAPASLPTEPSSPNLQQASVLGLAVGLLVGLGMAMLRERLDPRVRGREDLERVTDVPLLATIPRTRWLRLGSTILDRPEPQVAEAFRALRVRLLFASSQRPIRSLLVTSPTSGEGKSTTAANLAIALSEAGKRVVLIDMDLHSPTLGRFFTTPNRIGIQEVLTSPSLATEALEPTSVKNLSLISASRVEWAPTAGFSAAPIDEIVERLESSADFVIFDTTPILSLSDTVELAPSMDGVLMVVDVRKVTVGQLEESALQLRSVGANLLGVVATKVVPGRFRGYHHQPYHESQRPVPPPPLAPGEGRVDADGEVQHVGDDPLAEPERVGGDAEGGEAVLED